MAPLLRTRSWRWRAVAAILLVAAAGAGVAGQRRFDEREVKATFLFNFPEFVSWPQVSFADAQAPLVIGILGDDPFGPTLDAVVRDEVVAGHPLTVTRFRRVQDVDRCHILFVSSSEAPRLTEVIEALTGRAILTVGDAEGFDARGGMIGFITRQNRVRLRINLAAARAAGVTIHSRLLRVAESVQE